jgi:hypothetical protein
MTCPRYSSFVVVPELGDDAGGVFVPKIPVVPEGPAGPAGPVLFQEIAVVPFAHLSEDFGKTVRTSVLLFTQPLITFVLVVLDVIAAAATPPDATSRTPATPAIIRSLPISIDSPRENSGRVHRPDARATVSAPDVG